MSISPEQAVDAAIFLTIYRQAIDSLKESAARDRDNEAIESFTERILRVYDSKIFRRICYPFEQELSFGNAGKYIELVREVRAFQFSQYYIFLKYLPKFMGFQGNATEMLLYLQAQNAQLSNDIHH